MAAGNAMQSLTRAASPYLGEWKVAASQKDVSRSITQSLYVTVVESRVAHTHVKISLIR